MRATRELEAPRPGPDTVGYVRVSTEDQARDEKSSLADQRAAIGALATRLGRTIAPADVFVDPGVSGQSAEGRPAFMALLRYCEEHPRTTGTRGLVLVLNDSRFGRFRDPEEAAHWRFHLKRHGWIVRFAEGDDVDDAVARPVLRTIAAVQASEYSRALKANTRRGMRSAAARGLWLNEAPIGYRRLASGGGRLPAVLEIGQRKADDQQVRLTPGPEAEQALVRWMFESYGAGEQTLGRMAMELRKRWPARSWSRRTVQVMLKNRTYVGDVLWSRRPHDTVERRETPVRPEGDWVVTLDAHPALVSRELFDRVQARLAANRKARRWTGGGYPLSGLIRCATCGHAYIGGGGNKNHRDPADPDRYRFYKDSGGQWERDVCPGRLGTVPKRWIDPAVIDAVAKVVAGPAVQQLIAAEIDRVIGSADDHATDEREHIDRDQARLTSERDRLVAAVARGLVTDQEAAPTLAQLRGQQAAATSALERLRFRGRATGRLAAERDDLIALASDFGARAREAAGPVLRDLLRPWLADAVLDKEKRTLTLLIRRLPAVGPFLPAFNSPGPGSPSPAANRGTRLHGPPRRAIPDKGISRLRKVG
jgi:DNA invertase Pin-like site-specific DNA recombinase